MASTDITRYVPQSYGGLLNQYGQPMRIEADPFKQASASGSPVYQGQTQPDDYVDELKDPLKRMQTFEEMLASDDTVAAAHGSRVKMVTAGNWQLTPASDSPKDKEIAEFCEDNIYPLLDQLLNWLMGGALQYGFGLTEPVYQWSDSPPRTGFVRRGVARKVANRGRRIYLSKIAHARQRTIMTFVVNETGDLVAVRQYVFDGANFKQVDISPAKVCLYTYNMQGTDFWGVPPLRSAYKAYAFKTQLERLNILGVDRFGVGIPVAEAGPGWGPADYASMETYLRNWRAGTETFIINPSGGKVTIVSGDGTLTASVQEFIQFYCLAIHKVFFTQGQELGSTETGSRSVGEVMLEQMETIVQSDMEDVANIVNERIVVPLVRLNYGDVEDFPRFTPSQKVRASSALASYLGGLITQRAITWRPEDERWLRDVMHLPEVSLDELVKLAEERKQEAAAIAGAAATQPGAGTNPDGSPRPPAAGGGDNPPKVDAESAADKERQQTKRTLALEDYAPGSFDKYALPAKYVAEWTGGKYRTLSYSEWEDGVLRPNNLSRDLDLEAARLAAEVVAALGNVSAALAAQVEKAAQGGIDSLQEAVRKLAVPERTKSKLRAVMQAGAQRARDYGSNAVQSEIARQAAGSEPAPVTEATDQAAPAQTVEDREQDAVRRDAALRAEVDRAVEAETNRREEAARAGALLALHSIGIQDASATLAELAKQKVEDALSDLSVNRTVDNVNGVVNAGFGIGRGDGLDKVLQANPDGVVAQIYSCVMDFGSCDECAKWDGGRFPLGYKAVAAPNPRCAGTIKRCRCVWVYVTAEEAASDTPASKGPRS